MVPINQQNLTFKLMGYTKSWRFFCPQKSW